MLSVIFAQVQSTIDPSIVGLISSLGTATGAVVVTYLFIGYLTKQQNGIKDLVDAIRELIAEMRRK